MRQKYPASSSSQSSFEIEREPSDSGKTYPRGKDDGEQSFQTSYADMLISMLANAIPNYSYR